MMAMELIQPGTLWQRLTHCSEKALQCGALQPIETERTFIEQNGIRFLVSWIDSLKRKAHAKRSTPQQRNPFCPPEPALTVGQLSATHTAVLNKFNVLENHLLIITRAFEHQERLLTLSDFQALCRCMREYPSLGFYNGGAIAGASQPHKHLQLIPLSTYEGRPLLPLPPLLDAWETTPTPIELPILPFKTAFLHFETPLIALGEQAGAYCHARYRELLGRLHIRADIRDGAAYQGKPYNLLLSNHWMLLVPRSKTFYQDIEINALGFCGSFFVRDKAQIRIIEASGPLALLRAVT